MNSRTVTVNHIAYDFITDGLRRDGLQIRALLSARLIDEAYREPIRDTPQISTTAPHTQTRHTPEGIVGLVGVPERVFPANIDIAHYDFDVSFDVSGYLPRTHRVRLGPIAGYPNTILETDLPRQLGVIPLHREPVVIRGRVLRSGPTIPAPAATVRITQIIRQVTPATMIPVAEALHPVHISPPLYGNRDTTAQCRRVNLVDSGDPVKALHRSVSIGSRRIYLNNIQGLAAGHILDFDFNDPDWRESLVVASVANNGLLTSPNHVELEHPTFRVHRRDAPVRRVTAQAPGAVNVLGEDAIARDPTLLLDSFDELAAGDSVRISGGGDADEYHLFDEYRTDIGAGDDGYYRLPPINRVAQLRLRAEGSGQSYERGSGTPGTRDDFFIPDYSRRENIYDIVMS